MAKFQPGSPKPVGSGRKHGTKNKRTTSLELALSKAGLHVPEQLANLLPQLSADAQAKLLVDLMAYLYPKRKAIEHMSTAFHDKAPSVIVTIPSNGREVSSPEDIAARRARLIQNTKALLEIDNEFRQACGVKCNCCGELICKVEK